MGAEESADIDNGQWTQVVQKKDKKEKKGSSDKEKYNHPTKTCDADLEGWEQAGRKKNKKVDDRREPKAKPCADGTAGVKHVMAAKSQPVLNTQIQNGGLKLLCRYNVGIEQDRTFNVVRKLLG